MTIYDGGSSTSPMMGMYCVDSIPPSHISSSKEIMVHFKTASWITTDRNGFKMEYNPTGKHDGNENGFKFTYNPTSNHKINTVIIINQL